MLKRIFWSKGQKSKISSCEIVLGGVQVLRYPNFFSRGMEADRNVKVVGGDVAVL